jgi:hypothetical protein
MSHNQVFKMAKRYVLMDQAEYDKVKGDMMKGEQHEQKEYPSINPFANPIVKEVKNCWRIKIYQLKKLTKKYANSLTDTDGILYGPLAKEVDKEERQSRENVVHPLHLAGKDMMSLQSDRR